VKALSSLLARWSSSPGSHSVRQWVEHVIRDIRSHWRLSRTRWTAPALAVILAAAASARGIIQFEPAADARTTTTIEGRIRVVTVAEGLAVPWSLAFLPNGDILVTEREGRLRIVRQGTLDPRPVAGVPQVYAREHGGLMDVALHPNFDENRLVYLTYSKPGAQGATVAIARGRLDAAALADVHEIFEADAWSRWDWQFGSRIIFGWDGSLFVSIGDRNERERAQDLSDHAGTILRLRDDGSAPDDNPFVGQTGRRPEIYSYGHRNVQGLAIHPETGGLWASEHGPLGGDEVNVVLPGRNYGWPLATFGREYTGEAISTPRHESTEPPVVFWTPSIGSSGMMFYTGQRIPVWKGNLFVAATSGRQVQRLNFTDGEAYGHEPLLVELEERVRDVRQGRDGLVYVVTDAGTIHRIEPVEP
jgi:aldose sugar dehydrogenase